MEAWKERWVHSEFRDYLVTIEGYPIFEHPVMVEVDWTGDPAPSLHNEWAYTENALLTMEQIRDVQPADAALNPISGIGDFPSFGDAVIPISTIRIKSDLHTKGEELYKYVVRHELGHVIMHSLEPNAIWNLAISFGLNPGSAEAAAEWFPGEGLHLGAEGQGVDRRDGRRPRSGSAPPAGPAAGTRTALATDSSLRTSSATS